MMNEQAAKKNTIGINNSRDGVEVDVSRLFKAVWSRAWVVVLSAVVCAVLTLVGTVLFVTPTYESSVMFYVNNSSISLGSASVTIGSSDISASKSLVETYIVILKSRSCLSDVLDYVGSDYSYNELKDMISASSVNSTEIFEVVITGPDAAEAEQLANAIAYILPNKIDKIVEGTSAAVVDYAIQAASPSAPSYPKNTVVGFALGLVVSVLALVLHELFDVTIRTEEDVEQCCTHPILASVPDMLSQTKSGYGYGKYGRYAKYANYAKYAKYSPHAPGQSATGDKKAVVGKDISFAASEAYKLLRTKLQFSFVDEIGCPVIGVSSSLAGEGKSLTSVNLAYSLSQLDKKVLLIDCDMRRPSLAAKLSLRKAPGLSNYLTNQSKLDEVTQHYPVDTQDGFTVIVSGRNPPNPLELLSSAKMERAIQKLREAFDYIILDLPPVGEVSDALVASKLVDGMLLVVRQDYCNTVSLSSTVSQFEFIDTRILGVVINCVGESSGHYGRYGKRYYKKYYSRYQSSYAAASAGANGQPTEGDGATEDRKA